MEADLEAIHISGVYSLTNQCRQDGIQFDRIIGSLDQCDFKESVVKCHISAGNILESTYRIGIGNHSKDEIVLNDSVIIAYLHMVGFHIL